MPARLLKYCRRSKTIRLRRKTRRMFPVSKDCSCRIFFLLPSTTLAYLSCGLLFRLALRWQLRHGNSAQRAPVGERGIEVEAEKFANHGFPFCSAGLTYRRSASISVVVCMPAIAAATEILLPSLNKRTACKVESFCGLPMSLL